METIVQKYLREQRVGIQLSAGGMILFGALGATSWFQVGSSASRPTLETASLGLLLLGVALLAVSTFKLPRLRVRELLFLVVYAALIGQAFVLSLTGATRSPRPPTGYVWVHASEMHLVELRHDRSTEYIDAVGEVWDWRIGEPFTGAVPEYARLARTLGRSADGTQYVLIPLPRSRYSIAKLRAVGHPSPGSDSYYLVPEEWVK